MQQAGQLFLTKQQAVWDVCRLIRDQIAAMRNLGGVSIDAEINLLKMIDDSAAKVLARDGR